MNFKEAYGYKVISSSLPSIFENKLNEAVENGLYPIRESFTVTNGGNGTLFSILVVEDLLTPELRSIEKEAKKTKNRRQ